MFKKALLIFLVLISFKMSVYAISAESAVLIDRDTGRILYEKNAYEKRGMASTTKIMTAILALEHGKPDAVVEVSHRAASTEGSSMYLNPGEKIKLESLVYGLMLNSGNDAATAIAEGISGSVEEFANLMNKKAKEIGMNSSSFSNPHGLDNESHYSTAYDMALLTKYAMQNDTFKKIVSTKRKNVELNGIENSRYLSNHNKLLTMYSPCIGVKTGFTKACGRCLVSAAEKDGVTLIAVTLNAPDDWNDHISMYESAFPDYKSYDIIKKYGYIASADVIGSNIDKLELYAKDNISLSLTGNEYSGLKVKYDYPHTIQSPIYKGQKIGKISVLIDNKEVAATDIITGYGIEKNIKIKYTDTLGYIFTYLLSLFIKAV